MEIVINILIPMFAIMLTGFFVMHFKMLPVNTTEVLIVFIFKVAAPALIFIGLATAPLGQIFHWKFIFATLISISVCLFPWYFILKNFSTHKSSGAAALIAYSVSLGNSAFIGLPILLLVAGKKGTILAIVSSAIVVGIFMPFVVFCINRSNEAKAHTQVSFFKEILNVCKNPIVLASILGVVYSASHLPMPKFADSYFTILGSALAPVALFAVGAGVSFADIKRHWKFLSWMSFFKMFLTPLIAYLCALLLKLDPLATFALVLIAAVPSPKTAYVLAKQFNYEPEIMAGHIALSTMIGLFTIFGLLLFVSIVEPSLFSSHIAL